MISPYICVAFKDIDIFFFIPKQQRSKITEAVLRQFDGRVRLHYILIPVVHAQNVARSEKRRTTNRHLQHYTSTILVRGTRKCIVVYLQFSIFDMYEEKCYANQKA